MVEKRLKDDVLGTRLATSTQRNSLASESNRYKYTKSGSFWTGIDVSDSFMSSSGGGARGTASFRCMTPSPVLCQTHCVAVGGAP